MRRPATGILLVLLAASAGCGRTEMATTHYLAVYDPQEQVTEELYRVRITGSAPGFSDVNYATGWVPADVADLVDRDIEADRSDGGAGSARVATATGQTVTAAKRRFYEVGPLGVSMAPEQHRFVVVMGSNPDYFFQKMGLLTAMRNDPAGAAASARMLRFDWGEEALLLEREVSVLNDALEEGGTP